MTELLAPHSRAVTFRPPDAVPGAMPAIVILDLDALEFTAQNPRTDGETDLDGIIASLKAEQEPYLVDLPEVWEIGPGRWQVTYGERRVRAVRQAGWKHLACIVEPSGAYNPRQRHRRRIIENLHRRDLDPMDEARALKIEWLSANGEALGLNRQVDALLDSDQLPRATLEGLTQVLMEHGFLPSRPAVTIDQFLKTLGLTINKERYKKLVRVLALDADVQDTVRDLKLTEAALRALGTLVPSDQTVLVAAIIETPYLGKKVRRIARAVRSKGYCIERAVAETRGQVYMAPGAEEGPGAAGAAFGGAPDTSTALSAPGGPLADPPRRQRTSSLREPTSEEVSQPVMALVEAAGTIAEIVDQIKAVIGTGGIAALPDPFNDFVREAVELIRLETDKLAVV